MPPSLQELADQVHQMNQMLQSMVAAESHKGGSESFKKVVKQGVSSFNIPRAYLGNSSSSLAYNSTKKLTGRRAAISQYLVDADSYDRLRASVRRHHKHVTQLEADGR